MDKPTAVKQIEIGDTPNTITVGKGKLYDHYYNPDFAKGGKNNK